MVNINYYMLCFISLLVNFWTYTFTNGLLFSAWKSVDVQQTWSWQTVRLCHTSSGMAWDQNLTLEAKSLYQIFVARVYLSCKSEFRHHVSISENMPVNLNCLPHVIFSGLEICEWLIIRKSLKPLSPFLFPFETEFKRWSDCKVLE